jgi:hypothetical protein
MVPVAPASPGMAYKWLQYNWPLTPLYVRVNLKWVHYCYYVMDKYYIISSDSSLLPVMEIQVQSKLSICGIIGG